MYLYYYICTLSEYICNVTGQRWAIFHWLIPHSLSLSVYIFTPSVWYQISQANPLFPVSSWRRWSVLLLLGRRPPISTTPSTPPFLPLLFQLPLTFHIIFITPVACHTFLCWQSQLLDVLAIYDLLHQIHTSTPPPLLMRFLTSFFRRNIF